MVMQNTNQSSTHQEQVDRQPSALGDFFAQPYNNEAGGFNFSTEEEFKQKSSQCRDACGSLVKEFEIQFVDGSKKVAELFCACGVDQANLGLFFQIMEKLGEDQWPALFYLCGMLECNLLQAVGYMREVLLFLGPGAEVVNQLFIDCTAKKIPEGLRSYFAYRAIPFDGILIVKYTEFVFAGDIFTAVDINHE